MPNLKDLKNRIASVKSTRKITKAMQMVAAAKLRRAQEAAEASRPYTERFNAVLGGLAASVGSSEGAPILLRGSGRQQGSHARRYDVRAWAFAAASTPTSLSWQNNTLRRFWPKAKP
jgi:hypothetical protein